MKYQIENTLSGHVFGIYEGGSKEEALDALAVKMGRSDALLTAVDYPSGGLFAVE